MRIACGFHAHGVFRSGGPFAPPRTAMGYLIFLPAITVSDLPAPELAVASTLTFSFFGFLASRLPRFFSLDMGMNPSDMLPRGGMPDRVVPWVSGEPEIAQGR